MKQVKQAFGVGVRRASLGLLVAVVAFGPAAAEPAAPAVRHGVSLAGGEILPTGMRVTPTAARGAQFLALNPDLPTRPDYLADHAVSTAVSPNGQTLLVLTSGYNRNNDANGRTVAAESNEYVFVYDISGGYPVKRQALQVPNTFAGIAWNPNGAEFYVAGGVNDNVHVYTHTGAGWAETVAPIALGHGVGLGLQVRPLAAGLAVNASGTRLLVANYENDSVSLVDLVSRAKLAELDLRPGKNDPSQAGVPGGEYPFWAVFKGDDKAYVSSQRDREIVVLGVHNDTPHVTARIKLAGQPNKMLLNRDGDRLYVANDNSDSVAAIDTATDAVIEEFNVTAPESVFPNPEKFKGANSNSLALSPDERTLFVTNGGLNAVAVVQLAHARRGADGHEEDKSRVVGLIPTGWYPNAVSVSPDGAMLYVVNGKSNAGPNPGACRDTLSIASGSLNACRGRNQYVWQLHKAGFLALPMPTAKELAALTWQVAYNNRFPTVQEHEQARETMDFLRAHIQHVIYVVKENRTYDQVLGNLEKGNGDPNLAILAPYSPNHLQLARQFVTLDNFHDTGETSNTGWNWTTAARTTDFTEKTAPVNYAGRGLTYDWEGTNRNINVGFATVAERQAANPYNPADADLLPGTADVAAPDSSENEAGAGYLWDAALRAGLSVRNYGFYGDLARYFVPQTDPAFIPLARRPHAEGVPQFIATKASLRDVTDPYFRGYDMKYPDFWRYKEWEREFDEYVGRGELPRLILVRLPRDHFGDFATSIDGVNTVETQMADNDYALGLLVEKVAKSRYRDNTLIFVIEDDAQNGPDHVDPHRSIAYVIGPYVKQGALVSEHYTTVSMLRTIEEVLGIEPLGVNDGLAEPMAEMFDKGRKRWDYQALVPEVLYTTQLPLPPRTTAKLATPNVLVAAKPKRDAAYWDKAMAGQNFTAEDRLDEPRFNSALWTGLKGEGVPYPAVRHGQDLRQDRATLLKRLREFMARN